MRSQVDRRSSRRGGLLAVALVLTLGFTSFAAAGASGTAKTTVTTCAALARGSAGPAVATLQSMVKVTADGDFGPMTEAAVKTWQKKHHVAQTGVVDSATWAALPANVAQRACAQLVHGAGVAATCATLTAGATGTAVAVLQKAIGAAVDGEFGPMTAAAVKQAQTKAKLTVSGVVGPATWAALALTGTPACVTGPTGDGSGGGGGGGKKPKETAHDKAVKAVRDQVARLAAELLDQTGASRNPIALKALAFAWSQKGKPYKWGAVGPKAYDCSGLAMTSYLRSAITLPRVAADQYGAGKPVPLDQAEQGDLLFYASDLTNPATIYHVVMYAGDGQIVDAPYTGAFVGKRPLWTQNLLPIAVRPAAELVLPLQPGTTGWTVTQLQQELNRHGAKLTVDGGYGPASVAAVLAWKHAHGLKRNATVYERTWLTFG